MKKVLIVLGLVMLLLVGLNFDVRVYVSFKDASRITSIITGAGLTIIIMALVHIFKAVFRDIKEGNRKLKHLMNEVDNLLYFSSPTAEERRAVRLEKWSYLADPEIVKLRTA